LVLGLCFVFKVGILELGADIESQDELLMGLHWLLTLNESEDLWAIDVVAASVDDGVTDFTNEYNES